MSTEAKVTHTPGPWTAIQHDEYSIIITQTRDVLNVAKIAWLNERTEQPQSIGDRNKADAFIIAAAPDMLEALELEQFVEELKATHDPRDIIRLLESRGDYESGHLSTEKLLEEYAVKAALSRQSAIAKAKGGAA